MTFRLAALAVALSLGVITPSFADDVTPCEDMLATLRAAEQGAKLSEADTTKLKEFEDKGIERCNADDDLHADEFFAQAMAVLGK